MRSKLRSLPIDPQPRDVDLLRGLFDARLMTLGHIATLYFPGKSEDAAKKRVQKLKAAGFIGELRRRVNERSVLFLTKAGYRFLLNEGHLENHPRPNWSEKRMRISESTLRHERAVMDVKAALCAAVNQVDRLKTNEFCTWPHLNAFRVCRPRVGDLVTVYPDALIRIEEALPDGGASEHCFFIELDRSTETLDVLCQRALCYRAYYTSGGFAVRLGGKAEAYKEFPFRVLIVLRSPQRRDNVADELLKLSPPILSHAWLTTYAEAVATPLGPIWIEPLDRRMMRDHRGDGHPVTTGSDVVKRSLFVA